MLRAEGEADADRHRHTDTDTHAARNTDTDTDASSLPLPLSPALSPSLSVAHVAQWVALDVQGAKKKKTLKRKGLGIPQ
eukprot:2344173-Rhodomonas_salina.1